MPGTLITLGRSRVSSPQEIIGAAPEIRFSETDQTDPAGRWRIRVNADQFSIIRQLDTGYGDSWIDNTLFTADTVNNVLDFQTGGVGTFGGVTATNPTWTTSLNGQFLVSRTGSAETGQRSGIFGGLGIVTGNSQSWTNTVGAVGVVGETRVYTTSSTITVTGAASFYADGTTNAGAANVTITNRYGLYVANYTLTSGALTNQYGIYIEDMTSAATLDYGIYIAGADTRGLYVAADGITTISAVAATSALLATNTNDAASVLAAVFEGDRATPADNDEVYASFRLSDSAGTQREGARLAAVGTTILAGATGDTDLRLSTLVNNTLTEMLRLDGANNRVRSLVSMIVTGGEYIYFADINAGLRRSGNSIQMFNAGTSTGATVKVGLSLGNNNYSIYANNIGTSVGATIEFDPNPTSDSIASATTFVLPRTVVLARTQTLTGSTQVTNLLSHFVVGALTLTDTSAVTIDKATGIEVTPPVEAGSVTLTMASALRVLNTTGTPTYQAGLIVEALTAGATGNFQILLYNGGTEPTAALADTVGLYAVDIGAAAVLGIVSETAVVTPAGDFALTSKLIVRVNGVSYAIGMTTVLT